MAEQCWEPIGVDMNNWAPWCRFFQTSDDKNFVIDADLLPVPGWIATVIRRPTAVFYCTANAGVTDMNADFMFPPETTPEQAIAQMGYELVAPRPYTPPEVEVTYAPAEMLFAEGSTGPEGSTA